MKALARRRSPRVPDAILTLGRMADELEQFLDPHECNAGAQGQAQVAIVCDLLLFDYDGDLYAIPAASVDSVVAWKAPAPVAGTDTRVRGVVQDRGRIVVVMGHPTGEARSTELLSGSAPAEPSTRRRC